VWMASMYWKNCIIVRKHRLDPGMHLIRSWTVIMGPTECGTTILLSKPSQNFPVFHSWNQAFRILGFLVCSPNVNSSWYREEHREGRLIWPYHARVFQLSGVQVFMVVTPSFTYLRITFGKRRFSNCNRTVDVGFVKLMSDSFCGNGPSRWLFSSTALHLCCSSSVIFGNNPSRYTMISFCRCWISPAVPLHWCCLPMIGVMRP
jgi:hypothetical protein